MESNEPKPKPNHPSERPAPKEPTTPRKIPGPDKEPDKTPTEVPPNRPTEVPASDPVSPSSDPKMKIGF